MHETEPNDLSRARARASIDREIFFVDRAHQSSENRRFSKASPQHIASGVVSGLTSEARASKCRDRSSGSPYFGCSVCKIRNIKKTGCIRTQPPFGCFREEGSCIKFARTHTHAASRGEFHRQPAGLIEALEKPAHLYPVYAPVGNYTIYYRTPGIIYICIGDHPDTEHPCSSKQRARGALGCARSAVIGDASPKRERAGKPSGPQRERAKEKEKRKRRGRVRGGERERERARKREGARGGNGRRKDRAGERASRGASEKAASGSDDARKRETASDCLGMNARSHARRACSGLGAPRAPSPSNRSPAAVTSLSRRPRRSRAE